MKMGKHEFLHTAAVDQLDKPALSALKTKHAQFADEVGSASAYREDVAPFAAVTDTGSGGSSDLASLVRVRKNGVVFLQSETVETPEGARCEWRAEGVQMLLTRPSVGSSDFSITRLTSEDVPEMLDLVSLTAPGPFSENTIQLGAYVGVKSGGRLIAMAGERMRLPGYCEVSAVCVHPEYRRQGLARHVTTHVMRGILDRGEVPFLHAFANNLSAIDLYRDMGFEIRRPMRITALKPTDGWCVLNEADGLDVELHFSALSEDEFRHRFGSARSSQLISEHVRRFFVSGGVAVGFFRFNRLVAIGEVRPSATNGPDVCEFGLSILFDAQGRGLGSELMEKMRSKASELGFRSAEVFVDYSNQRMLALLQKYGALAKRRGGTLHFRMEL